MQKEVPDPTFDAIRTAADALRSLDLRTVRGEQRDLLRSARESVYEAERLAYIGKRNQTMRAGFLRTGPRLVTND